MCVPESVLLSHGEVKTILLDERYAPFAGQGARLENLCGSFTEQVHASEVGPVLFTTHSDFGMQKEVFNVNGNAAIHQGKASFMGVRSMEGLQGLARGLNLGSAKNQVHMAVICSKIGKRVQVSSSGLLERRLLTKFARHMRVDGRMFEHTNTVRLCVHTFTQDDGIFHLEERFRPQKNDWAVTGRGTVMARFTWDKRIEWTQESEEAFIALCDKVTKECLFIPDHDNE